ncbi:unnamed protein product, partial [Citrullus colocynthis]
SPNSYRSAPSPLPSARSAPACRLATNLLDSATRSAPFRHHSATRFAPSSEKW